MAYVLVAAAAKSTHSATVLCCAAHSEASVQEQSVADRVV